MAVMAHSFGIASEHHMQPNKIECCMRISNFVRLLILPSLHVKIAMTMNVKAIRNTVENSIILSSIKACLFIKHAANSRHDPSADSDPVVAYAADD